MLITVPVLSCHSIPDAVSTDFIVAISATHSIFLITIWYTEWIT